MDEICKSWWLGVLTPEYNRFGAYQFSVEPAIQLSESDPSRMNSYPVKDRSATYDLQSIMHYTSWASSNFAVGDHRGVDRMVMVKWRRP